MLLASPIGHDYTFVEISRGRLSKRDLGAIIAFSLAKSHRSSDIHRRRRPPPASFSGKREFRALPSRTSAA